MYDECLGFRISLESVDRLAQPRDNFGRDGIDRRIRDQHHPDAIVVLVANGSY